MRKLTFYYNGFHGLNKISFLIPASANAGDEIELTPSQLRRANKMLCGSADCRCNEGFENPFIVPADGETIKGNYPQAI